MLRGIYSESGNVCHLRMKSALLREYPDNPANYIAQFNPLDLMEAYGWWPFKKTDFVNVQRLGGEA